MDDEPSKSISTGGMSEASMAAAASDDMVRAKDKCSRGYFAGVHSPSLSAGWSLKDIRAVGSQP